MPTFRSEIDELLGKLVAFAFVGLAGAGLYYYGLRQIDQWWRVESQANNAHIEGIAAIQQRDYARAVERLTDSLKLRPKDVKALLDRAHAHYLNGDAHRAVADCDEGIALNKSSTAPNPITEGFALAVRGAAYLAMEEFDRAADDLTESIRRGVSPATNFRRRATANARRGQLDRAIADLLQAFELSPKSDHDSIAKELATLYFTRGFERSNQGGQRRQAIDDLSLAIFLDPGHARAYSLRSVLHFGEGDLAKSNADRDTAIRLDPSLDFTRKK